jgi:2-polyprenyl-3-methyl-5-hydroxy-6-metoxy-1,4-benzoquinol methylase
MTEPAPDVSGRVKNSDPKNRRNWFLDHISKPIDEIEEFLSGTMVSFAGARILDVGCGDGFIDLGLVRKLHPSLLVGTDLFETDLDELRFLAREHLNEDLPDNLKFSVCTEQSLPFPDSSFDVVMSWSVFEHVSDPVAVLRDIRRVLRPGGYMFLQIWPLFFSQHGSHLWKWFPEGWQHLFSTPERLSSELSTVIPESRELLEATQLDLNTLNRITVDQLQDSIAAAGLSIRRVGFQADTIDIPSSLSRYRLTDLAISGVKILAQR